MPDYYGILQVEASASWEEIQRAYRREASRHHPDRGGQHAQMVLINEAREVLSDSEKRRRYDQVRTGTADLRTSAQASADADAAKRQAATYLRNRIDLKLG